MTSKHTDWKHCGLLLSAVVLLLVTPTTGCVSGHSSDPPQEQHDFATHRLQISGGDELSRDDLRRERILEWERFELVGDRGLRVFFTAGAEHCYGHRVSVEEGETTVKIAVFEGVLPNAADECTLEARQASLAVETVAPVGDRSVVPLWRPEAD